MSASSIYPEFPIQDTSAKKRFSISSEDINKLFTAGADVYGAFKANSQRQSTGEGLSQNDIPRNLAAPAENKTLLYIGIGVAVLAVVAIVVFIVKK